ncbi:ECs_2282 family putative zinc-binding protein [Pseudomonas lundensis]|uniref:ECs_2282 family putative zinc-binding protein n=1 Tax=Pseudomonas lundensis TaxID=86185 RepID=UPI003B97DAD1
MNIELQCAKCGCKDFQHPDSLDDESIIVCNDCGASGPYGELRDQAVAKVKDMFDGEFGKLFKGG